MVARSAVQRNGAQPLARSVNQRVGSGSRIFSVGPRGFRCAAIHFTPGYTPNGTYFAVFSSSSWMPVGTLCLCVRSQLVSL